ncbi:MAG: AmmeMemoRadiSam system protein B [Melioribacteraceae bacterium]|nr:AmmeMemoRadiSam system protein B [Melioribacteraceae bacterium]MCF8356571.1 AmmeMemoRadiSam system protein B [Melioribacteraceae bacterium]MCF8395931.1 AmmeMemoRadiSam system protein B [Melioribacteraceae bacterium]MCF8420999.1 AmmeMemoRadiSam system protein B [Melioribacteraceae bacterium]
MKAIREATVAGMFYPGSPSKLRDEVNLLLELGKPGKSYDKIFGLVSPHAGYTYSGRTAAFAYNTIRGEKYETVIVISPSHNVYFPGACIFDGEAYKTPLGLIQIDKDKRSAMIEISKSVFAGSQGHGPEHALEVQLPFLQTVLDEFKLVPVVIGDQNKKYVDELAIQIAKVSDDKTLVVASSDLSHFYTKEIANKLDSRVAEFINNFDYESLQSGLDKRECEACGGGAIVAMMKAAEMKNAVHSEVLNRSDSGDVLKEKEEVVGYLSAVVYG